MNPCKSDIMPIRTIAEALSLQRQLCFALYSATHAVTRSYRSMLAEHGLTYPQYLVVLALMETPSMTSGDLARALKLDPGTLTPLLKRLETNGFVTRLRDVADERRVHITLTPAGRKLKSRAADMPACLLTASHCSIDELIALTRQLQTLRDRVKAAV